MAKKKRNASAASGRNKPRGRPPRPDHTIRTDLPRRLDKPLRQIADDLANALNPTNRTWDKLVKLAQYATSYNRCDRELLEQAGIVRDLATLHWTPPNLVKHLLAMVDATGEATEPLLALASAEAEAEAAVEQVLQLHQHNVAAAEALLCGQLRTAATILRSTLGTIADKGKREILAADYTELLERFLVFHAFDCARLGAVDARDRMQRYSGIVSLDSLNDDRPASGGSVKNAMLRQIAAAERATSIRARSPDGASSADTMFLDQLGLTAMAEDYLATLRNEHGNNLLPMLAQLEREATNMLPRLKQGLAAKAQGKGKMRHLPHIAFGPSALAQLFLLCSSMAGLIAGTGEVTDTDTHLSRAAAAMLAGDIPAIPAFSERDGLLARALHLALRMTVAEGQDAVPQSYRKLQVDHVGSGLWYYQPPVTFEKVYVALRERASKGGQTLPTEYVERSNELLKQARSNPSDPDNARVLLEAQGRLWFRLRL